MVKCNYCRQEITTYGFNSKIVFSVVGPNGQEGYVRRGEEIYPSMNFDDNGCMNLICYDCYQNLLQFITEKLSQLRKED